MRFIKPMRGASRLRKILALLLVVEVIGALGLYAWLLADLPPLERLGAGLALPSSRIYDRNGQLLYEIIPPEGGRNTALPLDAIPQACQDAVVSTEDANFYNHPGVDLIGIARAAWINLQGGEVLAGGSTITQQVARGLLLDPEQRLERSLQRKLREMVLALRLQHNFSKQDILALYLNQSYFGNLAYGIEAAARAYFGKGVGELSLAECALLAGTLQNPATVNPSVDLPAAQERQAVVLRLMVQAGKLTQAEADAALNDELQYAASPFPIRAPHAVMAAWEELQARFPEALLAGGLDVTLTIDLDWQEAAQDLAQAQLFRLNNPQQAGKVPADAHNAALVALDPFTGQVLTLLGSPDYFDETIDGALNAALAYRQPGSALKPFTYAAAFDPLRPDVWTAATLLYDIQTPFITRRLESYSPANFGLVEHGPVLAREALASSLNIPAVVTLEHVGIQSMVQLMANAGVESLARNPNLDLAVTLGGGEVRLLDLTQAYSIFPNGGYRIEPTLLLRVEERDGALLYQWSAQPLLRQVLDERVAFLINDILSDNAARSIGFGLTSALNIGRPAAAKTGTTTNFRDNWVVGYTPNLVVGVWVGNADNTPMIDVTGVSGAAPIWNAFMRRVLLGQPETAFARPDGLVRAEVCALSGLLPTPACAQRKAEWFIEGTVPTQLDNLYQTFTVDSATGALADENTPPERRQEQVVVILPQEARGWGALNGYPDPPAGAEFRPTDSKTGVRLLAPDPYTIFQINPVIPLETQRLRFYAAVPEGTVAVTYTLNGVEIGSSTAAAWEVWWTLALGDYELVAVARLEDGSEQVSAPVPFRVVNAGTVLGS